jgi:hypothetical protein
VYERERRGKGGRRRKRKKEEEGEGEEREGEEEGGRQVWWYTPVIPALERMSQEDQELQSTLDHIVLRSQKRKIKEYRIILLIIIH